MACQQIIYILVLTIFGAHGITLTPAVWVEGETGSLTCTHHIAVVIRLDGNEITTCLTGNNDVCNPPGDYFTITLDGATNTVTFTINSVTRTRDTGTWKCDGDGSVVVDVKVKPTVQILITPVNEGEKVKLTCVVVEANPPAPDTGFTWEKDGTVITDATTSTYTINLAQSVNDVYVCTGNNGVRTGRSPSVNIDIRGSNPV